jgi:hypothetical protein
VDFRSPRTECRVRQPEADKVNTRAFTDGLCAHAA